MSVVALVLAAGRGTRLDRDVPKALLHVAGRSLLHWSAEALGRAPVVDAVLAVLPEGCTSEFASVRSAWSAPARLLEPVTGGRTRQDSVRLGLAAALRQLPDVSFVLVHDAARCLVEPGDAVSVFRAAQATGAALPVVPLADTVKIVEGASVASTPDRSKLVLAQTPQAFEVELLRRALEEADRRGFRGTDCASLVERLGVQVRTCPGRSENLKVTHPRDLELVEARLEGRAQ